MVDEDLSTSLQQHHSHILKVGNTLERDIKRLFSPLLASTHSRELEAALSRLKRTATMHLLLPLAQLDSARLDIQHFMNLHLHQICGQKESQELIKALVERLSNLQSQVFQMVKSSKMSDPKVALRVMATLSVVQPLVVNYHCGVLEGVAGRLGLVPLGVQQPPCSA